MIDFDLAHVQAAAKADPRSKASIADEINAPTQRLVDEYRPGASVYDFLSARTLDTTVPRY